MPRPDGDGKLYEMICTGTRHSKATLRSSWNGVVAEAKA